LYSVDRKMEVITLINTLDANSNVGLVWIGLSNDYKWSDEILAIMISKYTNVYSIVIYDYNDLVDDRMHRFIKQWVY